MELKTHRVLRIADSEYIEQSGADLGTRNAIDGIKLVAQGRVPSQIQIQSSMTTINNPSILDPKRYRPDFPILGRLVHGDHPLVYLDNAASTPTAAAGYPIDCRYL